MKDQLTLLDNMLTGEVYYDALHKTIYATDASVYRKIPLAVAYPKTTSDITKLIDFANNNATSLIPRTAGTSLAGQCVGDGIVVDVSKHFTNIIKVDEKININTFKKSKLFRKSINKFKVLSNGNFKSKIDIEADYSSKTAKEKIEKAGGQITVKNQSK